MLVPKYVFGTIQHLLKLVHLLVQAMAYRGLSKEVNLDALPEPGTRFNLQELIGEGTYGEVYSARDTTTGEFYFSQFMSFEKTIYYLSLKVK